jgi:hypothetical protein
LSSANQASTKRVSSDSTPLAVAATARAPPPQQQLDRLRASDLLFAPVLAATQAETKDLIAAASAKRFAAEAAVP